ncbi:MAG: aminoacyl-histidine dipeptidase [Roseburia sp.]|nr:aminoacyl-histidine dipeptidase [Roseburia sp.]MCM1278696.1 aminoacyl-histidine dipeptidase [Robinsoniella sp.]
MFMLEQLEPKAVFSYFEKICSIPHGSGNIQRISNYLVEFAKERNLEYIQDDVYNVIIKKDASKGYEEKEPVILQGHMDMVAVKKPDCNKDLLTDPLDVRIEGDFVYAKGTSLGGDDGIAVAYALALLDSEEIPHPPLEVVITVEEEVGMEGALAIDLSSLKGKRLLNIDSEKEGELTVSCAGGMRINGLLPVQWKDIQEDFLGMEIILTGLVGGHSGVEIHKNRGNANILMGTLLQKLSEKADIALAALEGGTKDNAIPREAKAVVFFRQEQQESCEGALREIEKELKEAYGETDRELHIIFQEVKKQPEQKALEAASMEKLIKLLCTVPNGVQAMSQKLEGLVETSLNLGIMLLNEEKFSTAFSLRSSVVSKKEALREQITDILDSLGATYSFSGDYPAWEYKEDSPLRDAFIEVYENMYGEKPTVLSVHAGLECGILAGKIKDLDSVSFGPDMENIHTTEEKLSISSTKRVWEFLLALLKAL